MEARTNSTEKKVPRFLRWWLGLPPLPPRTDEELADEFWNPEDEWGDSELETEELDNMNEFEMQAAFVEYCLLNKPTLAIVGMKIADSEAEPEETEKTEGLAFDAGSQGIGMTELHENPITCPCCNLVAVEGSRQTCGHGESSATYTCPKCGLWTEARGGGDINTGWHEPIQVHVNSER